MSEQIPKEELRQVHIESGPEASVLIVGVCITRLGKNAEGKEATEYLLVRRDLPNGQWYFPGGKVRQGETMKTALKRELEEELGLKYGIDYSGPFESLASGSYNIKSKDLVIVNVRIPQDALKGEPQLQKTDSIKAMMWTADPLVYDLTVQTREILEARMKDEHPPRNKMENIQKPA